MPNRILRDSLLDSPRFHSLSSDSARLLFVEMILLADDYGITPAYPLFLGRRTASARRAADEAINKMTSELADQDLIRLYQVGGQNYAYIPRFNNWPRAKKSKWPMPPDALGGREIKDLQEKRTANAAQSPNKRAANAPETETETETETATETETNTSTSARADHACIQLPNCPGEKIVECYHEVLPELPRVMLPTEARQRAMRKFWRWVLTSKKSDGQPRASNADEALAWTRAYFNRARGNDFLMGRSGGGRGHENWRCDFDFLLTERGRTHVIEKTQEAAA
jgi:hypothetical protein